jgi:hypothetical protein
MGALACGRDGSRVRDDLRLRCGGCEVLRPPILLSKSRSGAGGRAGAEVGEWVRGGAKEEGREASVGMSEVLDGRAEGGEIQVVPV